MDKKRLVSTKFWNDTFVEELNPTEKLLFLYLITNSLTNILGIYEISIKRISYDTGINKETVLKAFKSFEKAKKVYYIESHIILVNFLKNQNLNTNMKKGAINSFKSIPKSLQDSILGNPSKALPNDYPTLLNTLLKYEREIESEDEKEIGKKIGFDLFFNPYHTITKLSKTDKEATKKYWVALSEIEKQKAIDNIKPYYDSLNDKKYCKKARTYLSDKSFNDEFKKESKIIINLR